MNARKTRAEPTLVTKVAKARSGTSAGISSATVRISAGTAPAAAHAKGHLAQPCCPPRDDQQDGPNEVRDERDEQPIIERQKRQDHRPAGLETIRSVPGRLAHELPCRQQAPVEEQGRGRRRDDDGLEKGMEANHGFPAIMDQAGLPNSLFRLFIPFAARLRRRRRWASPPRLPQFRLPPRSPRSARRRRHARPRRR